MNSTVCNAMQQQPSVPKEKSTSAKRPSSDKGEDFRQLLGTKSENQVEERPEKPKKDLTDSGHEEKPSADESMVVNPEVFLNGTLQIPAELFGIKDFYSVDEENSLADSQEPLTLGVFSVEKTEEVLTEEAAGRAEEQPAENPAMSDAREDAEDDTLLTVLQKDAGDKKAESEGRVKVQSDLPQDNVELPVKKMAQGTENTRSVKQDNYSSADKADTVGQNEMNQNDLVLEKAVQSRSDEKQNSDTENAKVLAGKESVPAYAGAEPAESSGEVHTAETAQSAGGTQESGLMRQVSDYLNQNVLKGTKELELQLNPKELGKLSIRIASEDGKTQVTILCSNSKTLKALSESAGEIGRIMENNLGTPTNIVTEYKEEAGQGYSNESQDNNSNQDWNGGSGDGTGSNRHSEKRNQDRGSFIQQLRLGLV